MNITINLQVPDLTTTEPREPGRFTMQQSSGMRHIAACDMTARELVALTDAITEALPDSEAAVHFAEHVHKLVEDYNRETARAMARSVEAMSRVHALHSAIPAI